MVCVNRNMHIYCKLCVEINQLYFGSVEKVQKEGNVTMISVKSKYKWDEKTTKIEARVILVQFMMKFISLFLEKYKVFIAMWLHVIFHLM